MPYYRTNIIIGFPQRKDRLNLLGEAYGTYFKKMG